MLITTGPLVSMLPLSFYIKILLIVSVILILLLLLVFSLLLLINAHMWPMNPLLNKHLDDNGELCDN